MTTPNQPAPVGAFLVGGDGGTGGQGTNYGQNYTDELIRSLFAIPELLADNVLDTFAMLLGKLPLDALNVFEPLIDGGDFSSVPAAVSSILGSLTDSLLTILTRIVNQIMEILGGGLVTPINDAVQGVKDWFNGLIPGGDIVDAIYEGINGNTRVGTLLSELISQLQNIPFLNVGGVAGPSNIGGSVIEFLNQLVGGLVGTPGTGAGLPDVFNIAQMVSGWASQGRDASDTLAIRGNKSLKTGFLPSSQSNIGFDKIAIASVAPTLAVTSTTALTAYERISETISIGAVSWQGYGTTSVTGCYVNIYKMDTTTGLDTLVYTSSNLIGSLTGGSTPVPVVHTLSSPITALPTEVYGFEICITGAGTHNVAGATSWIADQTTFPLRWAARRNSSSTLSPSTRTPSYSGDVMFFEYAVSASSVVIPHSPVSQLFNAVSSSPTLPIPSWANTVQVVQFANGGGGRQGGTWGVSGEGGDAGETKTTTWVRGTDFLASATPILAMSIGAIGRGGAHSGNSNANGERGGSVVVTLPATTGHSAVTVTAIGGEGGDALNAVGSDRYGRSPGDIDYDGVHYVGGVEQSSYSSNGSAPGGGGSGGDPVAFGSGGDGAVGGIWIRFKQ